MPQVKVNVTIKIEGNNQNEINDLKAQYEGMKYEQVGSTETLKGEAFKYRAYMQKNEFEN